MLFNELIAAIIQDYGCKALMRLSKYQTQGESRSGFLMSTMNACIYMQLPKSNPDDGVSWKYKIEHHISKDTTQDATQLQLQTIQMLDDLFNLHGANSFQFWIDGARQQ